MARQRALIDPGDRADGSAGFVRQRHQALRGRRDQRVDAVIRVVVEIDDSGGLWVDRGISARTSFAVRKTLGKAGYRERQATGTASRDDEKTPQAEPGSETREPLGYALPLRARFVKHEAPRVADPTQPET